MSNEKGVTLIEVLVALSLSTVVLFFGYNLFSLVNQLWMNTTYDADYKSRVYVTKSALTNHLSDPVEIHMKSPNELQFQTFTDNSFKSLMYHEDEQSLWIYPIDNLESDVNFLNGSGMEIGEGITNFTIKDSNGNPAPTGENRTNGWLILSISYKKESAANSGKVTSVETIDFPIKLMK